MHAGLSRFTVQSTPAAAHMAALQQGAGGDDVHDHADRIVDAGRRAPQGGLEAADGRVDACWGAAENREQAGHGSADADRGPRAHQGRADDVDRGDHPGRCAPEAGAEESHRHDGVRWDDGAQRREGTHRIAHTDRRPDQSHHESRVHRQSDAERGVQQRQGGADVPGRRDRAVWGADTATRQGSERHRHADVDAHAHHHEGDHRRADAGRDPRQESRAHLHWIARPGWRVDYVGLYRRLLRSDRRYDGRVESTAAHAGLESAPAHGVLLTSGADNGAIAVNA